MTVLCSVGDHGNSVTWFQEKAGVYTYLEKPKPEGEGGRHWILGLALDPWSGHSPLG